MRKLSTQIDVDGVRKPEKSGAFFILKKRERRLDILSVDVVL